MEYHILKILILERFLLFSLIQSFLLSLFLCEGQYILFKQL